MTYNNIYEYFKDDKDLLRYFDPLSPAVNNEQAALEIYHKLIEYSREYKCKFVSMECGYIFYAHRRWFWQKNILVSFCLKPKYRTKYWKDFFWSSIQRNVGRRFTCCLFSKNTRAIFFLINRGMKVERSTEMITMLSI